MFFISNLLFLYRSGEGCIACRYAGRCSAEPYTAVCMGTWKMCIRDRYLHHADYIVMESTYGDRSHGEKPDYVKLLSEIIQETFDRGGNLVIP